MHSQAFVVTPASIRHPISPSAFYPRDLADRPNHHYDHSRPNGHPASTRHRPFPASSSWSHPRSAAPAPFVRSISSHANMQRKHSQQHETHPNNPAIPRRRDETLLSLDPHDTSTTHPTSPNPKQQQPQHHQPQPKHNPWQTALFLAAVPFLWGSYGSAIKTLFHYVPDISILNLNVLTYAVAVASLAAARNALRPETFSTHLQHHQGDTPSTKRSDQSTPLPLVQPHMYTSHSSQSEPITCRTDDTRSFHRVAAELGTYLFFGSILQIASLEFTTASRSAFFVQLTTVIVPILDVFILRAAPDPRVFLSAVVALIGVIILGQDYHPLNVGDPSSSSHLLVSLNWGDNLAVLAALFYTTHVLRLQKVVHKVPSLVHLVFSKAVVQFGLSALAASIFTFATNSPLPRLSHWTFLYGSSSIVIVAFTVFWIGAMCTAAATLLQVETQKRVGPSISAVVFSAQPVFAVIIAYCVLGERLNRNEWIGGTLVLLAGLALSLPKWDKNRSSS